MTAYCGGWKNAIHPTASKAGNHHVSVTPDPNPSHYICVVAPAGRVLLLADLPLAAVPGAARDDFSG
jgi:hypothetical protein